MALQCGTTSNGCQEKTGKYRIEYTIVVPSYVRYRYSGAWVEVKKADSNLTYRIDKVSQPGQGQGVQYRISVWGKEDAYVNQNGPDRLHGTYYPFYGRPVNQTTFTGPITSVKLIPNSPRFNGDFGGPTRFVAEIKDATGTRTFTCSNWTGPGATGSAVGFASTMYFKDPNPPPDYKILGLNFFRVDNQPEVEKWRFQVLDALNNVVFSREETTQPEAVIVPEAYGSKVENFTVGNSKPNVPLKIVNSEANNRKSTSVLLGNTVIKKLDSPLGASLYPRVCWDCEEDKKCPEGTCTVECGDKICCYNSLGISVKEFRK